MVNWIRCIAVAGTAFFTTLASLITSEALLGSEISMDMLFTTALIVGAIQGGLAFFKELQEEVNYNTSSKVNNENKKIANMLSYMVWL